MRIQWNLILALVFALIVAIFAVVNVEPVKVEYVFGTAEWPLILIILGSVLMGGIIIGSVGLFRIFMLQRKLRGQQRENDRLNEEIEKLKSNPGLEYSEEDKEKNLAAELQDQNEQELEKREASDEKTS